MSRADEPTMLPDGDDEITTDVDPAWIASIRADTNGPAPAPATHDADTANIEVDDWAEAEPRWDPEATVGASDGLIERIRQEVRSTPAPPVTTAIHASPDVDAATTAASSAAPAAPSPDVPPAPSPPGPLAVPAGGRAAPPPILEQPLPATPTTQSPALEAPLPAAAPSVEDLTSTTVRWEPRQRLAATAPVTDTVLLPPPAHHVLDKTKVAIALIVAVAFVIVAWLVVSSRGSDDPAPTVGSVPTSDGTDSSVVPSGSAPVDPDAPVEVGG